MAGAAHLLFGEQVFADLMLTDMVAPSLALFVAPTEAASTRRSALDLQWLVLQHGLVGLDDPSLRASVVAALAMLESPELCLPAVKLLSAVWPHPAGLTTAQRQRFETWLHAAATPLTLKLASVASMRDAPVAALSGECLATVIAWALSSDGATAELQQSALLLIRHWLESLPAARRDIAHALR